MKPDALWPPAGKITIALMQFVNSLIRFSNLGRGIQMLILFDYLLLREHSVFMDQRISQRFKFNYLIQVHIINVEVPIGLEFQDKRPLRSLACFLKLGGKSARFLRHVRSEEHT